MERNYFRLCCLGLLVWASGCASIDAKRGPIVFTDTREAIADKKIEADAFEQEGIKLRLYQQNKVLKYQDHLQVFTQISGNEGTGIDLKKNRKIIFSPGTSLDNFLITTETESENLTETSQEQLLMSNRGEILKFITGEYQSQKGKIKILAWSRTPIFPKKAVKIGDKWSYVEEIKVKLESFWISRNVEGPEKLIINCKLTGFTLFKGRRCAVIETQAFNTKSESYTALFKTMKLTIKTNITEKIYFDYKRGLELGRITKTNSFTTSQDQSFNDTSQSQSISVIDER